MTQVKRREVLSSIEEAVKQIRDGMTIGLGGLSLFHEPMALLRALIRKGVKDLTLVALDGGMGVDMLIGAGCVRKLVFSGISMQNFAPIPPNFREAVETGRLEICELGLDTHNPGPHMVITPLSLMGFDEETYAMRLESVHPGHTLEEVVKNTGFELILPQRVPTTPPPTEEEIAILRTQVDVLGVLRQKWE